MTYAQSPPDRFYYYLLSIPTKYDAIFDRRNSLIHFVEINERDSISVPVVRTCGVSEYLLPLAHSREAMETEMRRRIEQGDLMLAHVGGQTNDLDVQNRIKWLLSGQYCGTFAIKNRNEIIFWILTEHRWPKKTFEKQERSEGIEIPTAAAATLLVDSILFRKTCCLIL